MMNDPTATVVSGDVPSTFTAPVVTSTPAPTPPPFSGSGTITSPGGVIANNVDLLSRVLTPTMQTWEGKIAVATVTGIQVALGIFGLLCTAGVLHPPANLAAEITGVGEALAVWVSTNLVKNRTALKSAAVAAQVASTPLQPTVTGTTTPPIPSVG